MNRRTFLTASSTAAVTVLAGCAAQGSDDQSNHDDHQHDDGMAANWESSGTQTIDALRTDAEPDDGTLRYEVSHTEPLQGEVTHQTRGDDWRLEIGTEQPDLWRTTAMWHFAKDLQDSHEFELTRDVESPNRWYLAAPNTDHSPHGEVYLLVDVVEDGEVVRYEAGIDLGALH